MSKAPCDIIMDEIVEDDRRALVKSLFMYTFNTSPGYRPSDIARRLAALSVEELKARRLAADEHCREDRERR